MLRSYQKEACDLTGQKIAEGFKRPLVISPTSSGKSFMIAEICNRAFLKGNRVLCLTHQAEILLQNEQKLNLLNANIKTGIFCASTGRKETEADVIFASRDSLGVNLSALGVFNLIIVDEAHLVPINKKSRYQKIFDAVKAQYVVGFTGTPWRLDNGQIWGNKGFFDCVSYNINLDFLIEQGFIVPYKFIKDEPVIKTDDVRIKSTGDFDERELSKVSSTSDVVSQCVDRWQALSGHCKTSIFFCCSIAHAEVVANELYSRLGLENVGYIDGQTKKDDRVALLDSAKQGRYKALVNVGVLTTGVDLPPIDCVVMLRATQSAALFVQSIGRGLRCHPGKEFLTILDMTDNLDRFHSLANPLFKDVGEKKESKAQGDREAPSKRCPSCQTDMPPAKTVCSFCGHIFISHGVRLAEEHEDHGWFEVESYEWLYTTTTKGETCAKASFRLKGIRGTIKQWLLFKRENSFGKKHRGMLEQLKNDRVIAIYINGREKKYPDVRGYKLSGEAPKEPMVSLSDIKGAYYEETLAIRSSERLKW